MVIYAMLLYQDMLYTGKGDSGTTKVFGCNLRLPKYALQVEALGDLDELNCQIGLCAAHAHKRDPALESILRVIQEHLFCIQACVAGAQKELPEKALSVLEEFITDAERELPSLHSFIVPGATVLSGALDVARAVARRTERRVAEFERSNPELPVLLPYLNRLSSALFAAARLAALRSKVVEHAPRY